MSKTAILLIDIQYDFCSGGSLAVPHAEDIIEPINAMLYRHPDTPLFVSRDWHPVSTKHFKAGGGFWPPHCIAHTRGAAFHTGINIDKATIYSKGQDPNNDGGYSALEGTRQEGEKVFSLAEDIISQKITHLLVAGLATDYCVMASVADAVKLGINVSVNIHGVRAVSEVTGAEAMERMFNLGVTFYTEKS